MCISTLLAWFRMSSRILVTGATGFLGKRLTTKLRAMNFSVIPADLQATTDAVFLDVRDKQNVDAVFESSKPEVVVHFAAINDNNPNFDRPYDLLVNNLQGTLNICEAATRYGAGKIVFPSSTSIYGNVRSDDLPISEMTRIQPLTPYATSKACEEMLVRDYARRANLKAIVLRFSLIYGPGQGHSNAIEQFIRNAINGKPIELLGDGRHTREFLFIDDAVDALATGATKDIDLSYDSYLVSTGKPIKLRDLAEKISAMTNNASIQFKDAHEIFSQHYDVSRTMTNLNWQPQVSLDDGLRVMRDWIRGPS